MARLPYLADPLLHLSPSPHAPSAHTSHSAPVPALGALHAGARGLHADLRRPSSERSVPSCGGGALSKPAWAEAAVPSPLKPQPSSPSRGAAPLLRSPHPQPRSHSLGAGLAVEPRPHTSDHGRAAPLGTPLHGRPSTSVAGSRSAPEGSAEACPSSGEETRLRGELEHMQQALQNTQAALVARFRGHRNKHVSGAQFRTPEQALQARASAFLVSPPACIECERLRKLADELKIDQGKRLQQSQRLEEESARWRTMASEHAEKKAEAEKSRGELSLLVAHAARALEEANAQLASLDLQALPPVDAVPRAALEEASLQLEAERQRWGDQSAKRACVEAQLRADLEAALEAGHAAEGSAAAFARLQEENEALRSRVEELTRREENLRLEEANRSLMVAAQKARITALEAAAVKASDEALKEQSRLAALAEIARARVQEQLDAALSQRNSQDTAERQEMERAWQAEHQQTRAAAAASVEALAATMLEIDAQSCALLKRCEEADSRAAALHEQLAWAEKDLLRSREDCRQLRQSFDQHSRRSLGEKEGMSERLRTADEKLAQECMRREAAECDLARARELSDAVHGQLELSEGEKKTMCEELRQAAAEKQTLEESLTHQRAELSRVKASLDACTVELAAMGGALSEALSAHDSFRTISRRELQEADDQLAMAQRVGRELEASARSACVAREDALARTATLQREVEGLKLRLETVGSAMAVEMEEIERQLTEVQRTAATVTETRRSQADLRRQLRDAAETLRLTERKAADATRRAREEAVARSDAEAQRDRSARRSRELEDSHEELEGQREAATRQAALLAEEVQTLKAANSSANKTLEEALQSSVRLCIVAPTVNVSFAGKTEAFKASMPRAAIQETIEADILPRFSQCFTQFHAEAAPNGQEMDAWLKDVTMEMQRSIEMHVKNVFREID
ncbi:hypothetical protein AB1Y20_008066 [Prymnesium parvum]|uniref:Uncharacterized protein n=1 Tax=Prymnesium parvum TaxID=97485 RepID=A0AB34IVK3_PRYPA